MRNREITEVEVLKAELEKEKRDKIQRKAKEREDALKVIQENEFEKKKRLQEKDQDRLD